MRIQSITITDIIVPDRRRDDFGDLEGLSESIRKYGLLHPITVDDRNNLIAGERRLRACQLLEWTEIPCRMYSDLTEDERGEIELEENIRRKDLTPLEISKNLVRLTQVVEKVIQSEFPSTADEKSTEPKRGRPEKVVSDDKIAERVGIPRATIHNAKAHVKAVETYPELESSTQTEAIQTAKTLDKLPEPKREQARNNIQSIRKPSLPKPSKRSPLNPIQEVIHSIKQKGGALSFTARMTQQEQFNFLDDLRNCQSDLDTFIAELQDYFDDMREAV